MKHTSNVVKSNKHEFELSNSHNTYIISMHMRNMMATYGEEYVREVVKALFLTESTQRKRKKTV